MCELVCRWERLESLARNERQPLDGAWVAKLQLAGLFQYVYGQPFPSPSVRLLLHTSYQPSAVARWAEITTMPQLKEFMAGVYRQFPNLGRELLEAFRRIDGCELTMLHGCQDKTPD